MAVIEPVSTPDSTDALVNLGQAACTYIDQTTNLMVNGLNSPSMRPAFEDSSAKTLLENDEANGGDYVEATVAASYYGVEYFCPQYFPAVQAAFPPVG